MSETTPEPGQAEIADEPSMEDILASIRKIIADDDMAMDISAPLALETPQEVISEDDMEGLESLLKDVEIDQNAVLERAVSIGSEDSNADDPYVQTSEIDDLSDFDAELENLMADLEAPMLDKVDTKVEEEVDLETALDLDMDLVLDDVESVQMVTPEATEGFTPSVGDVVDLDIEALLSEVEMTPDAELNSVEGLSIEFDEAGDDFESLLDLEIPEPEEEISLSDSIDIVSAEISEDDPVMGLVESLTTESASSLGQDEMSLESLIDDTSMDVEGDDDNLFNELESLLADVPQDEVESPEGQISSDANADLIVQAEEDDLSSLLDTENDEIYSLLNDLTDDNDSVNEPLEALLAEPVNADAVLPLNTGESDMTLVKSLMADLTDPEAGVLDALETNSGDDDNFDDLDAILSDMESESAEAVSSQRASDGDTYDVTTNQNADNILDDILNMSLEDEIATHEDDLDALLNIPEPELNNDSLDADENTSELIDSEMAPSLESVIADEAENLVLNDITQDNTIEAESPRSSLMDIALEAEEDANTLEASIQENKTKDQNSNDGLKAGAAIGAAAIGASSFAAILRDPEAPFPKTWPAEKTDNDGATDDIVESYSGSISTRDVSPELTIDPSHEDLSSLLSSDLDAPPQDTPKETADMPNAAVNSDTILDDVSEEASVNAFASLNKMVEEKAIIAERGDRIGDLVMEALRPMLKEWLDENLKDIVERAVSKEVKRIASGK